MQLGWLQESKGRGHKRPLRRQSQRLRCKNGHVGILIAGTHITLRRPLGVFAVATRSSGRNLPTQKPARQAGKVFFVQISEPGRNTRSGFVERRALQHLESKGLMPQTKPLKQMAMGARVHGSGQSMPSSNAVMAELLRNTLCRQANSCRQWTTWFGQVGHPMSTSLSSDPTGVASYGGRDLKVWSGVREVSSSAQKFRDLPPSPCGLHAGKFSVQA